MRRELEYTLSFESNGARIMDKAVAPNITYAIAEIRKDYPDARMFIVVGKRNILPYSTVTQTVVKV